MNRREAIKSASFLIGSATAFTSLGFLSQGCTQAAENNWDTLLNDHVQQTLAAVVDTIIPTTDTPGAKELDVQLFIVKMLQDCHAPEDTQRALNGLKQLDVNSEAKYGNNFSTSTAEQRHDLLSELNSAKEEDAEGLVSAYKLLKRLTLRGYFNTEYAVTNITKYKMIPGDFKGCVPINA